MKEKDAEIVYKNDIPICPFCTPDPKTVIADEKLCYAKMDEFPVLNGH